MGDPELSRWHSFLTLEATATHTLLRRLRRTPIRLRLRRLWRIRPIPRGGQEDPRGRGEGKGALRGREEAVRGLLRGPKEGRGGCRRQGEGVLREGARTCSYARIRPIRIRLRIPRLW